MPKRHRDEAADNSVHVESSLESGRRFEAYIGGWVQETLEPRRVRPSSLPSLTPLTALISPPPAQAGTLNSETQCLVAGTTKNAVVQEGDAHVLSSTAPAATSGDTAVVFDDVMLEHVSSDPTDYERPARLRTTLDHLTAVGLLGCCRRVPARSAKTKELRRVHSRDLVDTIDQLDFFMSIRDEKSGAIGQDLFASEHTSRAARVAAGCVIEAAAAVVSGVCANAFALIRPPGHHAGPGNASGFCLFNNVAVAARAAQAQLMAASPNDTASASPDKAGEAAAQQKPRILILDWDVHHCDGTESIFFEDPSVLVISLHQYGNGRGHVLRKTPSATFAADKTSPAPSDTELSAAPPATSADAKDDINVDDLAALLLSDEATVDVAEKSEPTAEGLEGSNAPPGVSPAAPAAATEKKEEAAVRPAEATEGRRVRKAVDYNKLAAELDGDGEDDIAALFGVNVAAVSSSSSSSSSSAGVGSGSSGAAAAAAKAVGVHYAGDTVGLSYDDDNDPAQRATAAEEPFYPGTGHICRVGGETVAAAAGRNINIAWPTHDMGDVEYLQLMHEVVLPAAREFEPAVVFISAGFDSARGDLLGSMSLSPSGFYLMTRLMASHFPKLVVALEGGYNVKNVALGAEAVLRALLESSGHTTQQLPKSRMLWCQAAGLAEEIKKAHAPYWKCFSNSSKEE